MTSSARPRLRLAVVTCMDARIDPAAILGLGMGDAHVLRNAGGRVTDDVLHGVTLSVRSLGVTDIVVMQHTQCAAGVDDHARTLRDDLTRLTTAPELEAVEHIEGLVYDVETGEIDGVVRWVAVSARSRAGSDHLQVTTAKHAFATLRG